jgi:hypothetical protein
MIKDRMFGRGSASYMAVGWDGQADVRSSRDGNYAGQTL